jgi:nicotinate-nucleotide adenylyltransferase
MAVVARPGFVLRAALSVAARRFAGARAPAASGRTLADATPPAWILLTAPLNYASSSALRGAETSGGRKTS